MIDVTLTRIEIYRKHGTVRGSSQYLLKNLPTEKCGPAGGSHNFKQLPDLIDLRPEIWSSMPRASSTKGLAAMGYREIEAQHSEKVERHLFC